VLQRKQEISRWAGLILFLFFLSLFNYWHPYYRTIDDELLSLLANRWAISTVRIDFLPWSHILFSRLLGFLKDWNANLDWYGIVTWGSHLIPIACLFLVPRHRKTTFAFFALASFILLVPEITYPTFTTASIWVGLSGIFLFCMCENSKGIYQLSDLVLAFLMIFFSYLIRSSGGILCGILFLSVSVLLLSKKKKEKLFFVLMALVGAQVLLSRLNSKIINEGYPNFLSSMKSCTKIFDFRRDREISDLVLSRAQWSREQLNLLLNGFLDFREIHTQDACDKLLKEIPQRKSELENLFITWMNLLKQRNIQLNLGIFFLGFLFFQPSKEGWRVGALYLGFVILFISFCAIEMKVVDRVYMPFFNFLFFLWAIPGFSSLRQGKGQAYAVAIMILVFISLKTIINQQNNQQRHRSDWDVADDLHSRIPFGSDALVFVWPDLMLKNKPIFNPPTDSLRNLNIVHAVHDMVNLPFHKEKMKQIGINNFWNDLSKAETFWLVQPNRLWAVTEYLKKHHNLVVPVKECWKGQNRHLFKLGSGDKLPCPT